MTDEGAFRALIARFGLTIPEPTVYQGDTFYSFEAGSQDGVTGYSGFTTDFAFTPEGKFIQFGAWE